MRYSFKDWAIAKHASRNDFYDEKLQLPYSFHLHGVVREIEHFKYIVKPQIFGLDVFMDGYVGDILSNAGWGHDLIENCGVNYSEILHQMLKAFPLKHSRHAHCATEIIVALTNFMQGKNRKERHPDWWWEKLVNTPGAAYVKICDRLFNVKHSVFSKASEVKMYYEEREEFKEKIFFPGSEPMFEKMDKLFNLDI